MKRFRIDPIDFPLQPNESWWIVHPNLANAEFRVPAGAITVCLKNFLNVFLKGTAYNVISVDYHNGWVTVEGGGNLYDMPHYLFARYFDAEVFVVGARKVSLEHSKPFDYRPTLPRKPDPQLELFRG